MSFPFDHVKALDVYHSSIIRKLQRKSVWQYLETIIPTLPGSEILNITNDTQEDTPLYEESVHILRATDITEASLQQLSSSTSGITMASHINSHIIDPNHLDETFFLKKFDLIMADFDELGHLSPAEMENFFNTLPTLLSPHGRMIAIIKTRYCFWSILWNTLSFQLKRLINRCRKTEDRVGERRWKYQPSFFTGRFKRKFIIRAIKPIGVFLPPIELHYLFNNKPGWVLKFYKLEQFITRFKLFAGGADYFIIDVEPR